MTRVLYASAGRADVITAHRFWAAGKDDPSQVSLTFSGEVESFCHDLSSFAYIISDHPVPETIVDGKYVLEHRPKRAKRGLGYHIEEIRYGLSILRTAREFQADLAILDSGSTHYFVMGLFPLFGIKVLPVLHNALWPAGFRVRRFSQTIIDWLNARFWRRSPLAAIAVSPVIERQVRELAPRHGVRFYQMRPQFRKEHFASIEPPPCHSLRPFRIIFVGRLVEEKGALDLPRIARWVEDREPGRVRWIVCGDGPASAALEAAVRELNLTGVVELRGWTSPLDQRQAYSISHAAIVPTRSSFAEGLAMTAVEAILAGRPLISNSVVPAVEVLRPAVALAHPDDPCSYGEAALNLATSSAEYQKLCEATQGLGQLFLNLEYGLRAVLHRVMLDHEGTLAE